MISLMRKLISIWLSLLWFILFFIGWNIAHANDYEYKKLDIEANILSDGTMNVNENFIANFFVEKHWIIRDIPLNYSVEWQDFHIDISNVKVQWKNFTTSRSNWNVEIKIWDADRTLIWEQNYPISYSTYWLIRNFSWMWYAELYWNVVGYDFDTNINKVKAEINLPKIYTWFKDDDFLITVDWSTNTVKEFKWTVDWKKWDKIIITYDKWLPAEKGITLAIKFPNDYFQFDHDRQSKLIGKAKNGLFGNLSDSLWSFFSGPLAIILVILLPFFLVIFVFKKLFKKILSNLNGKSWNLRWNFSKQYPVIVQYDPPKWINSAEAWLLIHRKAQAKDLLSLIYKWACEWLIKISVEKTEWSFFVKSKETVILTKISDITDDAPDYEKSFFKTLVRNVNNKIDKSTNLYNRLDLHGFENYGEKKWRFKKNNNKGFYIFWAVLLYFLFNYIGDSYPLLQIILFCAIIFWIPFLWILWLQETEEWAKLISHVLWYKEFLSACDENKLRLFLKQDPLYFDKILPYAVVFWLETELLKKFEPIMKEMNIKSSYFDWDWVSINVINDVISSAARNSRPPSSSYSSSGWFSWGSSFGGGFSSGWGWGWWGWRSW